MQLENLNLDNLNINYWAIAPEIITSLTGVSLMLVDALQKKAERKLNALVALIGLALALLSVFRLGDGGSYFGGMVVTDSIRVFFSVTILIVAMIATLLASQFVRDEGLPPGEFFTLLLFGTAGMLMLASAGDLVMVFLGLEIASITTYVMAGYRRYDARATDSSSTWRRSSRCATRRSKRHSRRARSPSTCCAFSTLAVWCRTSGRIADSR